MAKKLLVILVDGCRMDYINTASMPFTNELCQRSAYSSLGTILGYSNAIRATAFTGTLPSTHGKWCNFVYDPANSPYGDINYLELLDSIPVDLARRASKFLLSKTFMKRIANRKDYDSLELGNVPLKTLEKFDFSGTATESVGSDGIPSFFDVLSENDLRYKYLEFPYLTTSRHTGLFRDSLRGSDVVVVYLPHLDGDSYRCRPGLCHLQEGG